MKIKKEKVVIQTHLVSHFSADRASAKKKYNHVMMKVQRVDNNNNRAPFLITAQRARFRRVHQTDLSIASVSKVDRITKNIIRNSIVRLQSLNKMNS